MWPLSGRFRFVSTTLAPRQEALEEAERRVGQMDLLIEDLEEI